MTEANFSTPKHTFSQTNQAEDALLLSLISISKILQNPCTADSLLAGLPLVNNRLTPELFIKAAERVGFAAVPVQRSIQKISSLVLPAVLLLTNNQTCILVAKNQQQCTVVNPLLGDGEITIDVEELEREYTGRAFLVQQHYRHDQRAEHSGVQPAEHWFWDVIFKSWPIYIEVLVASLLINVFALASPLFIMNVYDRVVPNQAIETLWVLAIGVITVFAFDFVIKMLRGYFIDAAGKQADVVLSATIFSKIMGIKMESKPASVGAFANNLSEFESFRDFLTSATLSTLIDLPFLFVFIAVVYSIGGNLAIIPLIILPLALLVGLVVQFPLKKAINALFECSAQKGATLVETLSNLDAIKTFGAEGQMQGKWEQNIGLAARLSLKARFLSSLAINLTAFLQQMASVAVVIYGVYKIADGDLTTGGLIACTILSGRAIAPVAQVAALLTRYHQAKASLNSVNRLMSLPIEREVGKQYLHRTVFNGAIDFKNVSFSYPDQPVKALDSISFHINAGERVGIIGRIGSGKSTLEKLILGLYKAQEGSILIDGNDIGQIDPIHLRRNIGYVPQDISLMYGSVRDNITFGSRFTDDAAILRAAEISGVTQFINKHPAGYDLPVGEGGASLSGGQRQSIALARAFLLAPPILIMDEPTNAMDNSTEEAFKQRFAAQLSNQTVIIVTHKASLLQLVDRLIVMDGSRVVADGPKSQVLDALKQGQIKVAS
jgi:ATP-binding cassette, subfamily C, bacterial LapB